MSQADLYRSTNYVELFYSRVSQISNRPKVSWQDLQVCITTVGIEKHACINTMNLFYLHPLLFIGFNKVVTWCLQRLVMSLSCLWWTCMILLGTLVQNCSFFRPCWSTFTFKSDFCFCFISLQLYSHSTNSKRSHLKTLLQTVLFNPLHCSIIIQTNPSYGRH